jgi:hypothetical protein
MRHRIPRAAFIGIAAVVVCWLMAACSGNTPQTQGADAVTQSATPTSADSLVDSTPATESSGPEPPQSNQNGGPSISVASLPIGGGVQTGGNVQCVDVHLTGVNQLPDQVTISVTGAKLKPDGLLKFVHDDCGQAEKRCTSGFGWDAQTVNDGCLVSVAPTTSASDGDQVDVSLQLSAKIACPNDAVCSAIQPAFVDSSGGPGSLGASQIAFTAVSPSNSSASSSSPS